MDNYKADKRETDHGLPYLSKDHVKHAKTKTHEFDESRRNEKAARDRLRAQSLRITSQVIRVLIFSGMSLLLSSALLPFGARPLGFALLASVSGNMAFAVYGGSFLSLIFKREFSAVYILCYTLLFAMRIAYAYIVDRKKDTTPSNPADTENNGSGSKIKTFFGKLGMSFSVFARRMEKLVSPDKNRSEYQYSSSPLFSENIMIRAAFSAVSSFVCGVAVIIMGGFYLYDLFSALLMIALCPLLTIAFSGYFEKEDASTVISKVGHLTLLAALVYSANLTNIRPSVLSILLSLTFTMIITSRMGILYGLPTSLVCGLACHYTVIPILILSSLSVFLLYRSSPLASVSLASASGGLWSFMVMGVSSLPTVLPALVAIFPIFILTDKLIDLLPYIPEKYFSTEAKDDFLLSVTHSAKNDDYYERLKALSEAFSSLSEMFYNLSDKFRRPGILGLRKICEDEYSARCAECRNRDMCWGAEYSNTIETITRLTSLLHQKGKAEISELSDESRHICINLDKIVASVNQNCAKMTEAALKNDKTDAIAADYEAIASILNDALENDSGEYECDSESGNRIYDYLSSCSVGVRGVLVCGKRNKRVIARGINFSRATVRSEQIRDEIEDICSSLLTLPTFEVGEDSTIMTLSSRHRLRAIESHGSLSLEKDQKGRDVCGDSVVSFSNRESYFYSIINDGMGSGCEAAFTSHICSTFLEKMLSAGNKVEITLRMLNNVVRSKNNTRDECSATVDIMELDLLCGGAVFIKSGAAPSYVVRDGRVYKLSSRTMPIGILRSLDTRMVSFDIHEGDAVIMCSDGITGGNDDCPWLLSLLSSPLPKTPDELRDAILSSASTSGVNDDLSVSVTYISKATEG